MEQSTAKPIRCRAAVSKAPGQPLEMVEVEVAPPRAHEVRVKVVCTSLCHTDLTFWRRKDFPAMYPSILGHEAVGVVESVGEHVEEVAAGDTVVPVFLPQCGGCADCLSPRSNICSAVAYRPGLMPRDGTTRFSLAATGEPVHGFLSVSSFAEYTVVDVAHVVRLGGSALPPEKACLLSCGVSTGVGAAWKVAAVEPGSTVAVFGLGTVGLAVAQGSKMRGAKRIIGIDLNPDKFEIGKRLGATDFINPNDIGEKTVSQVIKEMTGGGVDYSFECIGSTSVMAEAFESSRTGWGKTIILGTDAGAAPRQHLVVRHQAGAVGHRRAPRRDQAQGRHPRAGAEVPGQGAGAGRVRDAPDELRRHQPRVRPARAGEVPPLHHLDGRRRRAEDDRRVTPPPSRDAHN